MATHKSRKFPSVERQRRLSRDFPPVDQAPIGAPGRRVDELNELGWTIGDRLRKVRRVVGATQGEFAEALEVPEPRYASWENDRATPPNIVAVAKRIELATGAPAAWLLDVGAPPSAPAAAAAASEWAPWGSNPQPTVNASAQVSEAPLAAVLTFPGTWHGDDEAVSA